MVAMFLFVDLQTLIGTVHTQFQPFIEYLRQNKQNETFRRPSSCDFKFRKKYYLNKYCVFFLGYHTPFQDLKLFEASFGS